MSAPLAGLRGDVDAVVGWDPLFTRYFAFSTLRSLGYRTRVSVSNASDLLGGRAEPVRLRLSLHEPDGTMRLCALECGSLAPGQYWTLNDVEAFAVEHGVDVGGMNGELLGIVHQTPYSHEERQDVPADERSMWVGLGDDFVEYVDPVTRATGGVFYQCPPLNDRRLGAAWTTVCQSPKVLFDDVSDPYLLLVNVSTDHSWKGPGTMAISMFSATGDRIGGGSVTVPAFATRVVTLRALLSAPPHHGNAMLLGVSTGAVLVPFSFVRDRRSGALAIDHTMPPGSYHSAWIDKERRRAWASDLLRRMEAGRA